MTGAELLEILSRFVAAFCNDARLNYSRQFAAIKCIELYFVEFNMRESAVVSAT
jgi:hypothetical protein